MTRKRRKRTGSDARKGIDGGGEEERRDESEMKEWDEGLEKGGK